MMNAERAELMDRFATGYAAVEAALEGISHAELDRRPSDDEWSPREVVHHLADSEATAYVRLRKLIAEDEPLIQGYDEPEFARRLHYDRPIEPSLAVLGAVREASLQLLATLNADQIRRARGGGR